MPKKKEFLRIIDQPTPVKGGGAITAQTSSIAPPVVGTIPPPTNLTVTSMLIARSAQAPIAYINLSWTPSRNTTPDYYVVEYSKSSSFTNPQRAKAMGPSAAIEAATSTVYYIRVQAVYKTSISDWSNTVTPTTPADTTAPTDVSGVAATFVNGDVVVTWTEPGPTNETYKDARIRIWNTGRTILYGTYHLRGGTFIWTEAENLRLISGGVTAVSVDVTSRGWNNVYGTAQITSATLANPSAPTSLVTDFTTGDLIVSWTNPTGIPYRDIEVKLYESSSKLTTYKTWYLNGNSVMFSKEDNFAATSNNPDTSIYIEVKTRGWLGLVSSALTGTATHTAPPVITNLDAQFNAGDFIVKWDNPTATFKDIEVKIYESSSKITNYKTYYLLGTSVIFAQSDNYNVNGSTPDTNMYVEVKSRSWLGLLSSAVSASASLTAPNPVTSVTTDFTTGDLEIKWTNPTNTTYRDIEVRLYESASKAVNYKTYYLNSNRVIFSVEDNFTATGGVGDAVIYYEITVRSWLGVTSSTVTGTATHTAPDPVTSVTTDFTTGDLLIAWTNPITPFKDIEVKLYESSSKLTNYKTYYLNGNSIRFSAEDNLAQTANVGDRSIYYEIKARSWLGLLSTTSSATVTKALPAAPSNIAHTWTGDDGTFPASITLTWDAVAYVKAYTVTIDAVAVYTVTSNIFEYTYQQNVADHLGSGNFGDFSMNVAINAIDRINQSSTGASNNTITNAAPPAGSVITITAVGGFSTISAFLDLTKPIKDLMHYVYELHNGTSVTDTITTPSQIVAFDGIDSGTYTVKVHAVDLFNRSGSTITSTATAIDSITIEELRAEAKYTDDQGRSSPTLDTLKDDDTATTINYSNTAAGVYHWTKVTRPLLDRYGILSYYSPDGTEVYFGLSTDDVTYTWYSGPEDADGLVTEVASEAAAKTARISVSASTAKRFQLPAIQEARFVKVGHRSNNPGSYLISELYPRRLIQSDDIQAESIQTINLAAGIITADKTTTKMLDATFAFAGEIVVSTAGKIRSGQTAFDTGTGFYLGNDSGTPKLSIGSATTSLIWDNTNLRLQGAGLIIRTASSNQRVQLTSAGLTGYDSSNNVQVTIDTADGKLKAGGGAVTLDATGVIITSGGLIRAGQTAYDTGTGWWIGNDGGTVKASFGNASGDKWTWNGSVMAVTGQFNLSGVATIGTSGGLYQGTGTFASPTTGLKLFNSGGVGKLSTYNTGVEQVTLDTDGKLKAGAGTFIADSKGVALKVSTGTNEAALYKFTDATHNLARMYIYAYDNGSTEEIGLACTPDPANSYISGYSGTALSRNAWIVVGAKSYGASTSANIQLTAVGLNASSVGSAATIDITSNPASNTPIINFNASRYDFNTGTISIGGNIDANAYLDIYGINLGASASGAAQGQLKAVFESAPEFRESGQTITLTGYDTSVSTISAVANIASIIPTLALHDTRAVAADVGGMLGFGGKYTSDTGTLWAGIGGHKTNSTSNNYAGYLAFYTRANGAAWVERQRILDVGTVLIGKTSGLTGAGQLDVNDKVRALEFESLNEGTRWRLGSAFGTTVTHAGHVTVSINGTTYKLMYGT